MELERAHFLAAKVIDGTITFHEKAELDIWLGENPEHAGLVDQLRPILAAVSTKVNAPAPRTDAGWAALSAKMAQQPAQEAKVVDMRKPAAPARNPFIRYAIAASIAMLAMIGGYLLNSGYFSKGEAEALRFATAAGERKAVQLPDGSTVHLNAGSKLSTEPGFGDSDRRVRLEGEAYFEVAKDPARPFVITTGPTTTTVLGTAFNLRQYHAGEPVRLDVSEGKVRFQSGEGHDVILLADQAAAFDAQARRMATSAASDAAAWRKGALSFQDEPLAQALPRIEQFYDIDIRLGSGLKDARLTTRFEGNDAAAMLDILATMYQVPLRKDGKVAWLGE